MAWAAMTTRGVLGAAMARGMTGAAMHPLTPGGAPGTAMARGMPRAAMARGMPGAAMARDDWMPNSNRSRGVAWAINPRSRGCLVGRQSWQSIRGRGLAWLANRYSQAAVAGLLGWPIVTITINPRSRGCFSGPWFARRDRDNVCAAGRVKAPPWVEANRGAMVMAQGGSQQGRHGDGAHSGVRFF